jgi:hypothetical protein
MPEIEGNIRITSLKFPLFTIFSALALVFGSRSGVTAVENVINMGSCTSINTIDGVINR